mmetsp:Transcript_21880/g.45142  ORF Transcript_21880/g.45142 Transcript_21880/m.45142 type:complete len:235 (+) Transcript_21880:615-1319(+)
MSPPTQHILQHIHLHPHHDVPHHLPLTRLHESPPRHDGNLAGTHRSHHRLELTPRNPHLHGRKHQRPLPQQKESGPKQRNPRTAICIPTPPMAQQLHSSPSNILLPRKRPRKQPPQPISSPPTTQKRSHHVLRRRRTLLVQRRHDHLRIRTLETQFRRSSRSIPPQHTIHEPTHERHGKTRSRLQHTSHSQQCPRRGSLSSNPVEASSSLDFHAHLSKRHGRYGGVQLLRVSRL